MSIKAVMSNRGRYVAVLFSLGVVSNLLMLVGPIFMLQVYDRVLGSRSVPTLIALTALMISLYAFAALVEVLRSRIQGRFATLLHEGMSAEVFRASMALHRHTDQGDPIRDLDTVRSFVAGSAATSLMDLPWLPVYMALIFGLHPLLGWVAIFGALTMIALLAANEFVSSRLSRRLSTVGVQRTSQVEDVRANRDAIHAMGMLQALTLRWNSLSGDFAHLQQTASDNSAFFVASGKAFRALLQSAVLAAGAYLVIIGQLSPGLMLASSVISARALGPIEQVVGHWRSFIAARQALARLRLIPSTPDSKAMSLSRPREGMSVNGLSSGPSAQRASAISDVTFSLVAGEALGVIGLSGSGKSSVAKAIIGVWPKHRGEVRYDGAAVEQYSSEQLGEMTGYLPQDVELLDGSVADNICRFSRRADPARIIDAARKAGTHDLILRLSEGYETRIGPRGQALSGGQRQRIGLARALYGDPFLLVLDEPNANLDNEGETALVTAVQAAKERGAIVIVVAHRPGAVANVDKILFMQGGRQAAYGPRDEVLATITRRPLAAADRQRANV